jgi:hypothetical protein
MHQKLLCAVFIAWHSMAACIACLCSDQHVDDAHQSWVAGLDRRGGPCLAEHEVGEHIVPDEVGRAAGAGAALGEVRGEAGVAEGVAAGRGKGVAQQGHANRAAQVVCQAGPGQGVPQRVPRPPLPALRLIAIVVRLLKGLHRRVAAAPSLLLARHDGLPLYGISVLKCPMNQAYFSWFSRSLLSSPGEKPARPPASHCVWQCTWSKVILLGCRLRVVEGSMQSGCQGLATLNRSGAITASLKMSSCHASCLCCCSPWLPITEQLQSY